jgi:hypothetical protein
MESGIEHIRPSHAGHSPDSPLSNTILVMSTHATETDALA